MNDFYSIITLDSDINMDSWRQIKERVGQLVSGIVGKWKWKENFQRLFRENLWNFINIYLSVQ